MTDQRPQITNDEARQIMAVAHKIAKLYDFQRRYAYMQQIILENVRLLKEVNQHRQAAGLDPYTVHPIDMK